MNVGGHGFCMLACGVVFMMTTYMFANLSLDLEELEAIRRHKWLEIGTLTLISLASFYFFGGDVFTDQESNAYNSNQKIRAIAAENAY